MFEFINNPVKVEKDQPKPYKIEIDDTTVYCVNQPVDQESVPIIFKEHKYFGQPDPEVLAKLEAKVDNMINTNFIKQQVLDINSMVAKLSKR